MEEKIIKTKIPSDVPVPKFRLFQRVRYQDRPKDKGTTGVITGMYYVDFATAMLERMSTTGWRYELNKAMGKPNQELLKLIDVEITFTAYEENLVAIGEEETNV